jgi:hypothetical protein
MDIDNYFKIEMEVRDELANEVLNDIAMIYGNTPEIVSAVKLATLKALLSGPRLIMNRRQQNA